MTLSTVNRGCRWRRSCRGSGVDLPSIVPWVPWIAWSYRQACRGLRQPAPQPANERLGQQMKLQTVAVSRRRQSSCHQSSIVTMIDDNAHPQIAAVCRPRSMRWQITQHTLIPWYRHWILGDMSYCVLNMRSKTQHLTFTWQSCHFIEADRHPTRVMKYNQGKPAFTFKPNTDIPWDGMEILSQRVTSKCAALHVVQQSDCELITEIAVSPYSPNTWAVSGAVWIPQTRKCY